MCKNPTSFRRGSCQCQNLTGIIIVSGADVFAREYAYERGYGLIEFPPQYEKYPSKVAPLKRNTQIVEESDLMVAFVTKNSRGTWDSINKAKKKGLKVKIVKL